MIVTDMKQWDKEKHLYPEAIQQGVEFIRNNDVLSMEPGKYPIQGDDLFALIQEMTTAPKAERRPESHRNYTDIQYLASGSEIIGVARAGEGNIVEEDLLDEKDIVFYSEVQEETDVILSPGMFAVFFPADVHRPGCSVTADVPIRKVVIKIHPKLLSHG
jgi:biofilm protein TabA